MCKYFYVISFSVYFFGLSDCPWVNNCVGEFNQKYFIQFLFYVGLLSAYAIGLVLYTWVESSQHPTNNNEPKRWNFNNYKMSVQYGPVEDTNINSVITGNINNNRPVGSEPIHNESHIVKQTRM